MVEKITLERARSTLERLNKLPSFEDMSERDKLFYLELGRALLIPHLEDLMKEKKWVIGVIMAQSMLEHAGKIRLIWKYKDKISKKKILNFNPATITNMLLASEIIDKSTYEKMEKIRCARNKLAHDLIKQYYASVDKPNTYLNLIEDAIDIIKTLFSLKCGD